MLRNIYLEGELGSKFGSHWELDAINVKEALSGIECNSPGLREYFIQAAEAGVEFHVNIAGTEVEDFEGLFLKMGPGDIQITPYPAGSKSGGAKLLVAAVLAVATYGYSVYASTAYAAGSTAAATAATVVNAGYAMAINLALSGIQQLMAPDPATEREQDESYLFTGSEQNILEGDPVPLLYGELRVPGRPISFEVLDEEFLSTNNYNLLDIYNIGVF